MSWGVDQAIRQGYDSACSYLKEGEQPFPYQHHHFKWWWGAVVAKADHRDWGYERVRQHVLATTQRKRQGEAD